MIEIVKAIISIAIIVPLVIFAEHDGIKVVDGDNFSGFAFFFYFFLGLFVANSVDNVIDRIRGRR